MTSNIHRNHCYTRAILVACSIFAGFKLLAIEPYKSEISRGTQVYETKYFVSGTWHMQCTENTSGRDQGHKSIQIEKTNGKVIPRTGFSETSGVQPIIELWHAPKSGGHFAVRVGRNALAGSTVTLIVGGKTFEKVWGSSHASQCWTDDEETRTLLRLMLNSPELKYSYIDALKNKLQGTTKLDGFRDIIKHGVEFLGFNPFTEK